jgi:hypothetical protein
MAVTQLYTAAAKKKKKKKNAMLQLLNIAIYR